MTLEAAIAMLQDEDDFERGYYRRRWAEQQAIERGRGGRPLPSKGASDLECGVWGHYQDDAETTRDRLNEYARCLKSWKRKGVYDGGTDLVRVTP